MATEHISNVLLAQKFGWWNQLIAGLEDFVQEHKNEKDFSFRLVGENSTFRFDYTMGYVDTGEKMTGSLIQLLYRSYFNSSPKYFLVFEKSTGWHHFLKEQEAVEYAAKVND